MNETRTDGTRMEFGEVRMSFTNAGAYWGRAENISRLALEHVGRLVSSRLGAPGGDLSVERLRVPPVNVSFETMGDEAIAVASAEEIYRALVGAL